MGVIPLSENIIEESKKEDSNFETSIYDLDKEENVIAAIKKISGSKFKNSQEIFNVEIVRGELLSRNKTIEAEMQRRVASETIEVDSEIKVSKTGWTKEQKDNYKPKFEKVTKQKYTNEFSREAAVKVILDNNDEYKVANLKLDKLDKWLKARAIVTSYQRDILRSAIALANLMGTK